YDRRKPNVACAARARSSLRKGSTHMFEAESPQRRREHCPGRVTMNRGTLLFGSLSALLASFPLHGAFAQQPYQVTSPGAVYSQAEPGAPSRLQPAYARPISMNDARIDAKAPRPTAGPAEGAQAAQAGTGGV